MSALLTIILVIVSLSMFVLDREHKLAVMFFYFMGMKCFQSPPILGSLLNIPVCFFLSEVPYLKEIISKLKSNLLLYLSIGMVVITLVLFFNSPHYLSLKGLSQLIRSELLGKYFIIVYAFICIKDQKSIDPLLKVSILGIILLFYLNYFIH